MLWVSWVSERLKCISFDKISRFPLANPSHRMCWKDQRYFPDAFSFNFKSNVQTFCPQSHPASYANITSSPESPPNSHNVSWCIALFEIKNRSLLFLVDYLDALDVQISIALTHYEILYSFSYLFFNLSFSNQNSFWLFNFVTQILLFIRKTKMHRPADKFHLSEKENIAENMEKFTLKVSGNWSVNLLDSLVWQARVAAQMIDA